MEIQRLIPFPILFDITDNLGETLKKALFDNFPGRERLLLVSDNNGAKRYGEYLEKILSPEGVLFMRGGTISDVMHLEATIKEKEPDMLIGIGGGRILDTVKMAGFRTYVPFILVPTSLSHDGIISPVAVIDFGKEVKSVGAIAPNGVIVDINIIKEAPSLLKLAGCGDLVSNLSALEDWKLASKYKGEKIDYFAYMLSKTGAKNIILSEHEAFSEDFLKDLAEGLAASGLSMIIAGNSRPASGAEHLISHALDRITDRKNPHGIQVGIATIFTQTLRGKDTQKIINFFKKIGFPLTPMDIGIDKKTFMEAVKLAPSTRKGRFTILDIKNNPMNWEKAFEVYLKLEERNT